MTGDRITLFWVLVVGILMYLYVDIRMEKMKQDMAMQMYMFERALQRAIMHSVNSTSKQVGTTTSRSTTSLPSQSQSQSQSQSSVVDSWDVPTVVDENQFIDDIVPTRAELEAAGLQGYTTPNWSAANSQVTGLKGVHGYEADSLSGYATFPN